MKRSPIYTVGSPVLVVGRLCTVKTCVGLFGYVSDVWTEEQSRTPGGCFTVQLLSHPTLEDKHEAAKERRGDFSTWSANAQASDLRPLTGKARLARVAKLKEHDAKEAEEPQSPIVAAIMADMDDPAKRAERKAEEAAIDAEHTRIGRVFTLPGCVKRGDKSAFPAYRDPVVEAISEELRGYASKGPSQCTITERARWGQCLEATAQASFWSPREECRQLVKELDLDPFNDPHEAALYRDEGNVYAINGTLRKEAIKLWNRGAVITYIQDMTDAESCWSAYRGIPPAGFLVSYAFRRKLPV